MQEELACWGGPLQLRTCARRVSKLLLRTRDSVVLVAVGESRRRGKLRPLSCAYVAIWRYRPDRQQGLHSVLVVSVDPWGRRVRGCSRRLIL